MLLGQGFAEGLPEVALAHTGEGAGREGLPGGGSRWRALEEGIYLRSLVQGPQFDSEGPHFRYRQPTREGFP